MWQTLLTPETGECGDINNGAKQMERGWINENQHFEKE